MPDSHDLARQLRDDPPELDDVMRARMERRLLEAPREKAFAPRSRRPFFAGIGVGLAAAAAVALVWWSSQDAPADPVATFEAMRDGVLVRRGDFREGDAVETSDAQLVRVALGGLEPRALVTVHPSSRAAFEEIHGNNLGVRLRRGHVRVEFHPVVRGEESFVVRTANARVEVVGTVFDVRVDSQGSTHVHVQEGVVRVVPLDGRDAVLVHAGEDHTVSTARADAAEELLEPTPESLELLESLEPSAEEVEVSSDEPTERPAIAAGESPTDPEAQAEEPAEAPAAETATAEIATAEPTTETERATRVPSLSDDLRFDLAARFFERGQYARARHELYAVARSSNHRVNRARAWVEVAEAFERESDVGRAAEAYRRAASIGRGTVLGANALFALGRLRATLDDDDAARNAYRRYLEEAPGGPLAGQARRALCRLKERQYCDAP
ncbi:MAG: FecR family protein [Myxococcota bacterium]